MEKLYYSIGEVAEKLGESVTLVRFWANSFPKFIRPARNAKGNRMFTSDDIETFRQIHHLVKVRGMTLEGAARMLASERRRVDAEVRVLGYLESLKSQLEEIYRTL